MNIEIYENITGIRNLTNLLNVALTMFVGMYPEKNTLPEQPYPVRSVAGLVD
jgi:hypothetical protein